MKPLIFAFGCVLFGLSTGGYAWAEDQALNVSAHNAYAYATSPVQEDGAVFVELRNDGEQDVKITAAAADVSEVVELHTHIIDGDVVMMRQVDGYDIPAGESIVLEPMGHHIMLMGLKAPLVEGESFPVSITDANGASASFTVEIKAPGHDEHKAENSGAEDNEAEEDSEHEMHEEHAH
ncbi:MAG: copper chaperone PCu(A)C [Rhodospirillales bacterium]|nr:copper chaperone PCu(A)C [Rhodospirillales bacterium]